MQKGRLSHLSQKRNQLNAVSFGLNANRHKLCRGQGILEYVLLIALLSTLTLAFVKVMGQKVFGEGLKKLPNKATLCLSHNDSGQSCQ